MLTKISKLFGITLVTWLNCLCTLPLCGNPAQANESLCEHPTILKMLEYNNRLRQEEGLHAHIISSELTQAAQDHAWFMAKQHDLQAEEFEHKGRNGSPGRRAGRYGYKGVVQENLGRGYDSIQKVFDEWKNSPEHWAAIKSNTTDVGFGYAVAADGTTYWVGVYGIKENHKWNSRDLPSQSSSGPIHPFMLINLSESLKGTNNEHTKHYSSGSKEIIGGILTWVNKYYLNPSGFITIYEDPSFFDGLALFMNQFIHDKNYSIEDALIHSVGVRVITIKPTLYS